MWRVILLIGAMVLTQAPHPGASASQSGPAAFPDGENVRDRITVDVLGHDHAPFLLTLVLRGWDLQRAEITGEKDRCIARSRGNAYYAGEVLVVLSNPAICRVKSLLTVAALPRSSDGPLRA